MIRFVTFLGAAFVAYVIGAVAIILVASCRPSGEPPEGTRAAAWSWPAFAIFTFGAVVFIAVAATVERVTDWAVALGQRLGRKL